MKASAINPEKVRWLWHPFMPRGKLIVHAGQMGQGKSLLTCWTAAAASNGTLDLDESCNVVMLNAEDDPADTIRPRLEAAGADLDRIWIDPHVDLDADRLRALCEEFAPVGLISIDPIQAYFSGAVNSWKGQDVRRVLEPLRQLANELGIAIVLVQHLNRRSDAGDPLARIADSQGVSQMARAVNVWAADPTDPEGDQGSTKVLTRAKGNLTRSTASASFEIGEVQLSGDISAPRLVRGADHNFTAEDVVADHETRTQTEEAMDWLQAFLSDGSVAAKSVMKRAHEDGISDRTLKRAKARLKVESIQERSGNEISEWRWALRTPINTDGPVDTLGTVGHVGKKAKGANGAKSSNGATARLAPELDEAEL